MNINKILFSKPPPENQRRPFRKGLLKLLIILISMALLGFLGIGLGYWYNQLPENNPQRSQADCEKAGGGWSEEKSLCFISNRQAGEECTDGGQCQSGVCFPPDLTEEQQAVLARGENITGLTGACYPEELITGCVKQILKGIVSCESLCY